jgi:CheY-like chemotaxis protein
MSAVASARPTVLVIDDSDITRSHIARELTQAGMVVHELPSAIGATRTVLRNRVGVVVIDVNMPVMRGDHLATLFRTNPRFSRVGLLLISGESESQLGRLATEAGADGVLSKKRLDQLVLTVERIAARRKSRMS